MLDPATAVEARKLWMVSDLRRSLELISMLQQFSIKSMKNSSLNFIQHLEGYWKFVAIAMK